MVRHVLVFREHGYQLLDIIRISMDMPRRFLVILDQMRYHIYERHNRFRPTLVKARSRQLGIEVFCMHTCHGTTFEVVTKIGINRLSVAERCLVR